MLPVKKRTLEVKQLNFYTFALVKKIKGQENAINFSVNDPRAEIYYMTLPINPQEYIESWPTRTNVTQTYGGAWIDYYGLGIGTITMRGTTGWRKKKFRAVFKNGPADVETDGYESIKKFRDNIFRAFYGDYNSKSNATIQPSFKQYAHSPEWQLFLFDWANEDYYEVLPVGPFVKMQSASEPLLYRYSLDLIVLRKIDKDSYPKGDWISEQLNNPELRLKKAEKAIEEAYWRNFIMLHMIVIDMGGQRMAVMDRQQMMNLMIKEDLRIQRAGGETMNPDRHFNLLDDENLAGIARDDPNPEFILMNAQSDDVIEVSLSASATVEFVAKPVINSSGVVVTQAQRKKTIYDKLNDMNAYVNRLHTKLVQARKNGTGKIEENIKTLNNNLKSIIAIENNIISLPKEIIPYQLLSEIKNTRCLLQTVASFPEMFEKSIKTAYSDFVNSIRDSGCASTIGRP